MADSKKANAGWLCYRCRVMNGKHALHCHRCGGRWDTVGDTDHNSYGQWEDWENTSGHAQGRQSKTQWPKSPRRGKGKKGRGKTPSPRPKQRHADGQDTPRQETAVVAPPVGPQGAQVLPTGSSWMQAAQMHNAAASPPALTPAPALPPANAIPAAYRPLIESLEKNQGKGTLPEDAQQEMKTLKIKEEKKEEKELYKAVKSHSHARKELRAAYDGRAELLSQWRAFLSLSVSQWQTFTSQFQAQEAAALQKISDAKVASEEARLQFEENKANAGLPAEAAAATVPDVEIISEEDVGNAGNNTSAQKIQLGLQSMTESLQAVSSAAEQIHAEENAAKRARLADGQEEGNPNVIPSMEPFGQPGIKRPQGAGASGQRPSKLRLMFAMKWNHRILKEPDFCTEWQAQTKALWLSLTCGTIDKPAPQPQPRQFVRKQHGCVVSFSNDVTLLCIDPLAHACFLTHCRHGQVQQALHFLQSKLAADVAPLSATAVSSSCQSQAPWQFDEPAPPYDECAEIAIDDAPLSNSLAVLSACSDDISLMQMKDRPTPMQFNEMDAPAWYPFPAGQDMLKLLMMTMTAVPEDLVIHPMAIQNMIRAQKMMGLRMQIHNLQQQTLRDNQRFFST
eukprot:s3467_g2.t1